jgi:GxxExxY protein
VEKEMPLPLVYDGIKLESAYRLDLLVEHSLVIEIKSVETIHPIHLAQVLTYLRTGGFHLGLLINFNVFHLKDGIKRVIL